MDTKTLQQDHILLAKRIEAMSRALWKRNNYQPSEEEVIAALDLEKQALQHRRKALFERKFLWIQRR